MKILRVKFFKISTIVVMFFLMCVLQLWFSIILFIGFGLVLTIFTGKRQFCNGICPLGNIQDFSMDKKITRKNLNFHLSIKLIVGILFFGYLIFSIITYRDNTPILWQWMLRIMLISFGTAFFMQTFFGKRTWCRTICPAGNLMGEIAKKRRMDINKNKLEQ